MLWGSPSAPEPGTREPRPASRFWTARTCDQETVKTTRKIIFEYYSCQRSNVILAFCLPCLYFVSMLAWECQYCSAGNNETFSFWSDLNSVTFRLSSPSCCIQQDSATRTEISSEPRVGLPQKLLSSMTRCWMVLKKNNQKVRVVLVAASFMNFEILLWSKIFSFLGFLCLCSQWEWDYAECKSKKDLWL